MKTRRLFIVSLVINLLLVAMLLVLKHARTESASDEMSFIAISNANLEAPPTATTTPVTPRLIFPWRAIESDDYRQYIANLRAVGCPERLIRDIIVADIDDLYRQKSRTELAYSPPWESADHRRAATHARYEKNAALLAEKRALVKELIGYEWDSQVNQVWNQNYAASLILGFMPDATAVRVMTLEAKYRELIENVRQQANDILIEEDLARLSHLYEELVTEASQLLSPAEFGELEARLQLPVLMGSGIYMDGVTINATDFRALSRMSKILRNGVRNHFLGDEMLSEQEQARRGSEFDKQLKALLGPERFADYQRAQDSNFRDAFLFTQDHSLPKTAAVRIYDARRAAEDQANQLKSDKTLTREELAVALETLKTTVAGRISSALGGAYAAYQGGSGQWLDSLSAPPDPAEPSNPP